MTSICPQCCDLGPVLFNIVINDIDRGIECTHSKFENGTKMSDVVDTTRGQVTIQRDLDKKNLNKLEQRTHEKFMR